MRCDKIEAEKLLRYIAELAQQKKAENIKLLDIREFSNIADYFFICSGNSDRQVTTIAENIIENLKKLHIRPQGLEGLKQGRWIVIDYIDTVVHIFYEQVREFYEIDELWSFGVELKVSEK
ncbi:MAG: ribosome silencing factor [Deltaproteobacteria bacterium]|nr:ribosome silencing factor [Deltaproteobacteria bacterium]